MLHRAHWLLLPALLLVISAPLSLHASGKEAQVQIGKSIVIEENEQAGDLVCVGCSIRMAGTCGDVVAVGGSISVEGTVKGDVVAIGGGLHLGNNASVAGDVVTVGGGLHRSPTSLVKGSVISQSGTLISLCLVLVPLIPVVLVVALVVWLVSCNRQPALKPV
jgi:hypothetical protein